METQTTELIQLPGSQYLTENGTVLDLDQLHQLSHPELVNLARDLNLRVSQERTRHQFTFDLLKAYGARGIKLRAEGMLELSSEAYGFLALGTLQLHTLSGGCLCTGFDSETVWSAGRRKDQSDHTSASG